MTGRVLALTGLLCVFAGSSILFGLAWMPVWLVPFVAALKRAMLLGGVLVLLPLTYGLAEQEGQSHGFLGRFYLWRLPWLGILLSAPLLTMGLVAVQIVLIERNPHLTLSQYLREELWVVWLLMLPSAALWLAGHQLWLRGRQLNSR